MRQINCYIPIKLCITGRLSDARLDEFSERLARAVAARIAFAERFIAEKQGGCRSSYEVVEARDAWDSTRVDAATDNYGIASYKGPPKTKVKIQTAAAVPQRTCRTRHVLGQGELVPKDEQGGNADLYYRIWGTWKKSDTGLKTFAERVVNAWIPWRFGPLAPEDRHKVSNFLFTTALSKLEGGVGEDGCDYAIALTKPTLDKAVELSGEVKRKAELQRVREAFAAKPGEIPDYTKATVNQRLVLLEDKIRLYWTGNKDEQTILDILKNTPDDQAAELSRRLSTDRYGDETYFAALDRVVDLGNNLELHTELTKLHLRGLGGEKGVKAILEDALVLPWHDVMGLGFDVPVTFSVTPGAGGRIVIKYHRGVTFHGTDMPFQSELDALPSEIKIGGQAFDPDQLFKVHDWDEGKFVIVRARDLLAYQNIGIRNWLGHVATVASFAIPGGAAAAATGKIALFAVERAIPLFVLAVRENRLSLSKWFPTWGPRMIYFADVAELAIGVYGLASFARSGVKFFNAWREARFARKLWEAAESVDDAEKAAVRIENEADKVLKAVDEFKRAEAAGGHAKPAGAPQVELPAGPPAPSSITAGAEADVRAAATKSATAPARSAARAAIREKLPQGISEETVSMLEKNPELLEALAHNPRAARALTLCKSPCIPSFASPEQVARIERLLKEAEEKGVKISQTELKNFLHTARSRADLSKAISEVQVAVRKTPPGKTAKYGTPFATEQEIATWAEGVKEPLGKEPRPGRPAVRIIPVEVRVETAVAEAMQLLEKRGVKGLHPKYYGGKLHKALEEVVKTRRAGPPSGWVVASEKRLGDIVAIKPQNANLTVLEYLKQNGLMERFPKLPSKYLSPKSPKLSNIEPDLFVRSPNGEKLVFDLSSELNEEHLAKTMFYAEVIAREEGGPIRVAESYWRTMFKP